MGVVIILALVGMVGWLVGRSMRPILTRPKPLGEHAPGPIDTGGYGDDSHPHHHHGSHGHGASWDEGSHDSSHGHVASDSSHVGGDAGGGHDFGGGDFGGGGHH
jgi:hypothetical protein